MIIFSTCYHVVNDRFEVNFQTVWACLLIPLSLLFCFFSPFPGTCLELVSQPSFLDIDMEGTIAQVRDSNMNRRNTVMGKISYDTSEFLNMQNI